jgi:hypothetical protein
MNLVINESALDKTSSAVVSASDRTALTELEMLTVGNVEPFVISFCDSTGASPSWVTDAGTVVGIGLGYQNVDGSQSFALNTALTISSTTRIGTLDLDTTALRSAAAAWQCCCHRNQNGVWFTLEVRRITTVATVVTAAKTLALLPVFVCLPILSYT